MCSLSATKLMHKYFAVGSSESAAFFLPLQCLLKKQVEEWILMYCGSSNGITAFLFADLYW